MHDLVKTINPIIGTEKRMPARVLGTELSGTLIISNKGVQFEFDSKSLSVTTGDSVKFMLSMPFDKMENIVINNAYGNPEFLDGLSAVEFKGKDYNGDNCTLTLLINRADSMHIRPQWASHIPDIYGRASWLYAKARTK